MSDRQQTTLLWMFVVNLGIAFGAGLYEHRISVPKWISSSPESGRHWDPDAAREDDSGRRFWAFVTTGPLTLLTLANLWAASRSSGSLRRWWLAASGVALAERAVTFGYFIPTMVGLMQTPDSPEAAEKAARWSARNYGRHALAAAAWLSALKAFSHLRQRH